MKALSDEFFLYPEFVLTVHHAYVQFSKDIWLAVSDFLKFYLEKNHQCVIDVGCKCFVHFFTWTWMKMSVMTRGPRCVSRLVQWQIGLLAHQMRRHAWGQVKRVFPAGAGQGGKKSPSPPPTPTHHVTGMKKWTCLGGLFDRQCHLLSLHAPPSVEISRLRVGIFHSSRVPGTDSCCFRTPGIFTILCEEFPVL